ncbi:MAG: hypothetical protein IIT58_12855 [Treponema sp.]|nr:hypothetical protein [Treponema sp.]
MSDNKPRESDWEPGTLDRTRRAIGEIDPAEAQVMTKKLGGEIMYEKTSSGQSTTQQHSKAGRIVRNAPSGGAGSGAGSNSKTSAGSSSNTSELKPSGKGRRHQEELIPISAKLNSQIEKLMMSAEYQIKPNYGLFNFIKFFQTNGHEQIVPEFVTVTLKHHVENLQGFITVIKTLIQIAPASYKAKIANGTETKFKFLRMIAGWNMQGIKLAHIELSDLPQPFFVQDMIPYVRAVYRLLIQVYYFGDNKIPKLIKEIYTDENAYPDAPHDKLSGFAKQAITDWLYIQNEIIKKLYPLLMRMCSDTYEEYPDFFKNKVAEILKFVGLHKYDLLLPEKPKEQKEETAEKPKLPAKPTKGIKDSIVVNGFSILDQLFPQAGFRTLDQHPDMFPYFQPLYQFADGFNVLSPENPLQVTVVLLKLIEDCFQGCRNIAFAETQLVSPDGKITDSITDILEEWAMYRENYFERLYCVPLNDYVSQAYTQDDIEKTQYGKKMITQLLWQTQYLFLPNFKFQALTLERPQNEGKLKPLGTRTDILRAFLTEAVKQCDEAAASKGIVPKIKNPWEAYHFDISNEISKRLDVLTGAKHQSPNANNANLLKYTLCIVSVLDWWVNNPDSPAYTCNPNHIYRISETDGRPKFSVPERNDQKKLFADNLRATMQKASGQKA